jgi:3-oxoacyl-[acyl-carrier-protein] synthase II
LNDSTESAAIAEVFGEHAERVLVSATKPYYGHALGASGAIEAAICAMTLKDGWIPPTLNLTEPGEGCDLQYVRGGGRPASLRHALTNSFGFGGINASLLLSAVDRGAPAQ